MEGILNFVQMTSAYSNAVLVAILPHFTDVAQKLDLPISTPIVQSEIRRYFCDPRAGELGGYVTLTNGYEFWYNKGHVSMFYGPHDYFIMQNPDSIPKLYGKLRMNQKEAVVFARQSLNKLGYTNPIFDKVEPEVKLATPLKSFNVRQGVPQYQITWYDPEFPKERFVKVAQLDIDAEAKQIERFVLNNKRFWKPNPDVGVVPELKTRSKPQPQYVGGHQMAPVSAAYSNACMNTLYPLFSDFAAKLVLPLHLPITGEQCTNIECWTDKGQPVVQILLTNGDRFLFEHGFVSLFYAGDNYFDGGLSRVPAPGRENGLYRSQPVSKDEMIQIARQAIRNLGYSEKELHMEGPPGVVTLPNTQSNFFTRYEIGWNWTHYPSGIAGYSVDLEVDAKTKTIKFLNFLNNTNLWREPPKIEIDSDFKTPASGS
jgi:hypothetical protein